MKKPIHQEGSAPLAMPMPRNSLSADRPRRVAITLRGVIQGVGFRPFVYNAARARNLTGWVRNEADTVQIEIQGAPGVIDDFLKTLRSGRPPQARIDAIELREISYLEPASVESFSILASAPGRSSRPTIPADLATCDACLEEIHASQQRRYRYPFTNCTNCGPRWSIIERLPYDRPRTSMARFVMCPDCRAEYTDPSDRRFHAQPIACPRCGPRLTLLDTQGHKIATGKDALRRAVEAVRGGHILALKGLGGFQLIVDATNAEAVGRLRGRKHRPDRPLAVLAPTVEQARRWCEITEEEAALLEAPEAPILLLRKKPEPIPIAGEVAPENPNLGVMLPYTPLHHLLVEDVGRPLVCTSGNLSEEPMATATEEALGRLGAIAERFLVHDRPIMRPVDDSVARIILGRPQVLRRGRGYAPLPLALARDVPTILAVGGHLKNTVALGLGSQAILGSHVGDLESVLSVEVHRLAIRDLVGFFDVTPELIVCDLHPDYASTRYAETLSAQWEAPLVRVQHHHAHVAACMAEHGLEGPVLGLAWDGTGLGTDGTVWGSEILRCEGARFERVGHLRAFARPGGDRSMRQPRRAALGVLFEIFRDRAAEHLKGLFSPSEMETLFAVLHRGLHGPRTSSMGRLFDAVAALCGLPPVASFEGQAAMALEFAADPGHRDAYPLPLQKSDPEGPAVGDWEPMIRAVLADRAASMPIGHISARFHNALANWALEVARHEELDRIVLTGGCFQNALLTERINDRLEEAGYQVYVPRQVPPGDGGIALGQLWVAFLQEKEKSHVSRGAG